tara:strand:- start:512 stop:778 length:267 start_codon:yes stop_codon:yes gene_type:complete
LRKRRTTPNKFRKDSLISFLEDGGVHLGRYDSMGIARDLINFEKNPSGKVNGVPENLEPCVLGAYRKFKNNPSQLDDYEKLDRTIRST